MKTGPRDDKGRFIPRECPHCGCGKLEYEGHGVWACDGLVDPEDDRKELECCPFDHFDGEARRFNGYELRA